MQPAECYSPRCLDRAISILRSSLLKDGSSTSLELANYKLETSDRDLGDRSTEAIGIFLESGIAPPTCPGADIYTTDFTVDHINRWVSERTNGLIPEIIDNLDDEVAVLITTLYFKDKWRDRFSESQTSPLKFSVSENIHLEVPTMRAHIEGLSISECRDMRCLEMPYETGGYNFYIYLPTGGVYADLDWFRQRLAKVGQLRRLANYGLDSSDSDSEGEDEGGGRGGGEFTSSNYSVSIQLPKFTSTSEIDLVPHLKAHGVERLFTFTDDWMVGANPLRVSRVIQKVKVIVDESGTEAGAVTATCCEEECENDLPFTNFHCNRPFLYEIAYKDEVLFRGFYRA
jgi:serine protease inhibitor